MGPEFTVRKLLVPLKDKLDELRGGGLDGLSGVFSGTPDYDELHATPKNMAPFIRCTLLPGDAADYADDERIQEYPRVQVDFWLDVTADYGELEQAIYDTLHNGGWERVYRDNGVDGDDKSLRMVTGYFQYQGAAMG